MKYHATRKREDCLCFYNNSYSPLTIRLQMTLLTILLRFPTPKSGSTAKGFSEQIKAKNLTTGTDVTSDSIVWCFDLSSGYAIITRLAISGPGIQSFTFTVSSTWTLCAFASITEMCWCTVCSYSKENHGFNQQSRYFQGKNFGGKKPSRFSLKFTKVYSVKCSTIWNSRFTRVKFPEI